MQNRFLRLTEEEEFDIIRKRKEGETLLACFGRDKKGVYYVLQNV